MSDQVLEAPAEELADDSLDYIELLTDWCDPFWRIGHIYYVLTDEGKEIPFRPRPEQWQYLRNLWNRNVCLKSRKHGMTTGISILQLDQCVFVENFKAFTVAETMDKAKEIFRTKIEYAWDRLPPDLAWQYPLKEGTKGSKTELIWGHGSSIGVGTSARSGTLQSLHISEMGPISLKFPEKAREIVTGSMEAVTLSSGIIHVESTSAGQGGRFFELVDRALKVEEEGRPLTALDFRLHFFAWWQKSANVLDPTHVLIPPAMLTYFAKLEREHGILLTPEQKAWYVKTGEVLGDDMKSEHPSYPKEAFEVVIKGAIFGKEMTWLRKAGRLGSFPWVPRYPVNTFWDFGVDDSTSIWFHQRIRGMNRLVGYFEDQGYGLGYYVNECNSRGYTWGRHYIPHDAKHRMQGKEIITKENDLRDLGFYNLQVVQRTPVKNLAIDQARSFLLTVEIDAAGCQDGTRSLDLYQREWDEKLGRFSNEPRHDAASHGSDALMTGAQGYDPDEHRTIAPDQSDEILDEEVGH